MNKIIVALLVVFAAFEVAYAATYQPQNLGWVTFSLSSGTANEINTSTPPTVGYMRYCTSCTAGGTPGGAICISTSTTGGTTGGSYFILSTGTMCK